MSAKKNSKREILIDVLLGYFTEGHIGHVKKGLQKDKG